MELLMQIPNKTKSYFSEISLKKKIYFSNCSIIYSAFVKYATSPLTSLGLVNVNIPACPDRSRPLASHTGPHRMSSLWSSKNGHNLRPKKKKYIFSFKLVCNLKIWNKQISIPNVIPPHKIPHLECVQIRIHYHAKEL